MDDACGAPNTSAYLLIAPQRNATVLAKTSIVLHIAASIVFRSVASIVLCSVGGSPTNLSTWAGWLDSAVEPSVP